MPTLKSVVAFWQSEVENLQAQDQVIDDNDLNLETFLNFKIIGKHVFPI